MDSIDEITRMVLGNKQVTIICARQVQLLYEFPVQES